MTQKKSSPAHAAEPEKSKRYAVSHTPRRELPDEPAPQKEPKKAPAANTADAAPKKSKKHFTVRKVPSGKLPGLPKVVRWIVIGLLIASLALVIWTYRASLTPAKIKNWVQVNLLGYNDGSGYPITLTDSSVSFQNFIVEDGSPSSVSGTTVLYLSKGGKTLSLRQHGYTTPVMKRWGDNFLIYDLGNKSFRVSTNGTDFKETTQYDYPIFCGAIAKNGSYAIASASEGYTSQLNVYDRNGLLLFEWAPQDYLISSVAFSPNGKYIAASALASIGGTLKTTVSVFAFNKNEPLAVHTLDGCVMLETIFNDNNTVTAVGDTCAVTFDVGKELKVYDYEGLSLSAYNATRSSGTLLALSASSDGRSGSLIRLDSDFEAHTVTRFEHTVDSIQLYNNYAAMLSDGTLSVLSSSGSTVFTADAGIDAVKAVCSKGVCYVLGAGEIRSIVLDLPLEG